MKKRIILTIMGMSLALTACSGQAETSQQTPSQQTQEVETTAAEQTKEENHTQENQEQENKTQEEQEETTAQQETEPEQESTENETSQQETVAAAEEQAETEPSEKTVKEKGEITQADIAVSVRGVAVSPGEIMENYINALGEPDELSGVPSCVEEGDDKVYTYAGVVIYTYRANGTDRINLIEITGTESLVKGVHIGDAMDTVIAAYGDSYTMDGAEMLYEINDKVMGLVITDGKVSFMELFAR